MQNQVIADIEIEDQKIEYYSSVVIRQQFNAHHEFAIRIRYDVLGKTGTFSLSNSQKLIGKSVVIKLSDADTMEVAYEFRGIICEICMEQSDNFTSDLILKGYSPTILLENGPNLVSFYKKNLKDIVGQLTQSLAQNNYAVQMAPQYSSPITYICQYRESTFHFINRLSSDYGEWFYYDGKDLCFGKPSTSPNIDITYGEDVHDIQLKLRILPMNFSSYTYVSKDDKVLTADSPSSVDGLDEYASFALKESNKIFSEPVNFPLRQRVDNKGDMDEFLKKHKASMAANLEVLTGSSDNPKICIGAIASVKFSKLEGNSLIKEDYGKYLITAVEHHVTENGKYFNSFEAIPSGLEIIPVKNIVMPVAEPQIATVTDNKDPDNMGRVRVQMLWQQPIDEMTDFIRVSTPDAGGGKGGAKNRGLVVIPEPGDQVLVCFRYNDPNRPFVMGSMFHGKTGGGGGGGNKSKSLTALSGSVVSLDGDSISIIDAKGNIIAFTGTGNIDITCSEQIKLECGGSKITLKKTGEIEISGDKIDVKGKIYVKVAGTSESVTISSDQLVKLDSKATVDIKGTQSATLKSDTKVEIQAPSSGVKGDTNLKLEGATVQVDGKTMTNVNGGTLNLNCS